MNTQYNNTDNSQPLSPNAITRQTILNYGTNNLAGQNQPRISQSRESASALLPSTLQNVCQAEKSTQNSHSETQSMSPLDYMHIPPIGGRQQSLMGNQNTNSPDTTGHSHRSPRGGPVDLWSMMHYLPQSTRDISSTTDSGNYVFDLGHEWRGITLPSDIHSLLSGSSAY